MTVSRITGVESLRAALLAFPKELASKALDQALLAAAGPIRDEAEALAPRGPTLKLSASITIARDRKPYIAGMDSRVVIFVKWKGKEGVDYWRFPEFGTSKMAPEPFMRPAFAAMQQQALTIIFQKLSDAVPRIARSLSK